MAHDLAQGIASLGRNGDTMLVHMNPSEVAGLQSLAKAQGTTLSVNPKTGMPEAFSLGKFFKGLLPTVAGMGISAMFPGASPWLVGTLAGVGTTLATGNPLAGIMTGIGVGSGMGIGKDIFKVGTGAVDAGSQVAQSVTADQTAKLASAASAGQNVGPSFMGQGVATTPAYTGAVSPFTNTAINTTTMAPTFATTVGENLKTFGTGLSESFNNPQALINQMGGGTKAAFKVGAPLVGAAAEAMTPEPYNIAATTQEPPKSIDPKTGRLRLDYDTGIYQQMYPTATAAEGGYIDSYAIGGAIDNNASSSAGISDLYNRPEGQTMENLSQDGYGIGRLNRLANAEAMNSAKTLGYAYGGLTALSSGGKTAGYLDGQGDGMSDSIPATIGDRQPAKLADGEFVVPADVVSHIGNGSSKAGAKRLYAMMHKVRKARTGNPKQGKQINPNNYMPV